MYKSKNNLAYTLTATPHLFLEGQFIGKMKNVTFIAQSSTDTQRWFATNFGQFETAFQKLVPPQEAQTLVAALIRGGEVEFPGFFMEEQFVSRFSYDEHSGVIRSRQTTSKNR